MLFFTFNYRRNYRLYYIHQGLNFSFVFLKVLAAELLAILRLYINFDRQRMPSLVSVLYFDVIQTKVSPKLPVLVDTSYWQWTVSQNKKHFELNYCLFLLLLYCFWLLIGPKRQKVQLEMFFFWFFRSLDHSKLPAWFFLSKSQSTVF